MPWQLDCHQIWCDIDGAQMMNSPDSDDALIFFYNPTAHLSPMLDAHKMLLHHFLRHVAPNWSIISRASFIPSSPIICVYIDWILTENASSLRRLFCVWLCPYTRTAKWVFYCLVVRARQKRVGQKPLWVGMNHLFCSPCSWWLTHWVFMLTNY